MLPLKKTFILVMIGIAILAFSVTVWGETKNFRVGVAFKIKQDQFFMALTEGLNSEAAKNKNLELTVVFAEEKAETQISQVEDFIAAKVDAIILAAVDEKALVGTVEDANKANIPVVCVDTGVVGGKIVTLIASDNILAGKLGAEYMVKRINGKGNVVILDWPPSQSCRERVEGVKEVLSKYPEMKIIHQEKGKLPPETSAQVENILTAFPDIDVIYTVSDAFGPPAYREIKLAKKEGRVFVVSVDATPEARMLMKESDVYGCSVAQQPFLMGQKTIQTVVQYLTGEKTDFPSFIPVEVKLITKENADE